MKLNWPIKPYTDDEIANSHGDERLRRLVANDTNTYTNVTLLVVVILLLTAAIITINYFFYSGSLLDF